MFQMSFNNVELSQLIHITNVKRGLTPEIEHTLIHYDKLNGARLRRSNFKERIIEVEFYVTGEVSRKLDILARTLITQDDVRVIFGDQQDRYYLARLNDLPEYEKINRQYATGSFELICCEPFAFSITEKISSRNGSILTFNNQGSYNVYPTFEFTAPSDLALLGLSHPSGHALQIGSRDSSTVIPTGTKVTINTKDCSIWFGTVSKQRKYFTPSSRTFSLVPGVTQIGITVNTGKPIPGIVGKFREVFA